MNRPRLTLFTALLGVSCLLVLGCGGGGPELAPVSGTVTLDGQPLENATVFFDPPEGRGSAGRTDAQGRYELGFAGEDMGALLGSHKVRIIPATEDDDGNPLPDPVKLPEKYNESSELTAEVKSGDNTFDFQLESS